MTVSTELGLKVLGSYERWGTWLVTLSITAIAALTLRNALHVECSQVAATWQLVVVGFLLFLSAGFALYLVGNLKWLTVRYVEGKLNNTIDEGNKEGAEEGSDKDESKEDGGEKKSNEERNAAAPSLEAALNTPLNSDVWVIGGWLSARWSSAGAGISLTLALIAFLVFEFWFLINCPQPPVSNACTTECLCTRTSE